MIHETISFSMGCFNKDVGVSTSGRRHTWTMLHSCLRVMNSSADNNGPANLTLSYSDAGIDSEH